MTTPRRTSERLSDNLRVIMARRQIEVQALARKADLSESVVYRLKRGDQKWSAEQIEAIAEALEIDERDLLAKHDEVAA